MKFWPLLWGNLKRRKARTVFTLLSIVVAFILFSYLAAVKVAFSAGVDVAGADRLFTTHKTSIIQPLPVAYQSQIAQVPGVVLVTHATWFGGIYQNPNNGFQGVFQGPIDPESYLAMYPEFKVPDDQKRAWMEDREGVLVGTTTAQRFGWKVGDRVPIQGTFWRKKDGSNIWEFNVRGIYTGAKGVDTTQFLFHYDYFDEARQFGAGIVGWYMVRIADPKQTAEVCKRIDAIFENSPAETKTVTEKALAQSFADQIGDIGSIIQWILTAVFFTLLLVTGNTIAQSVRERTSEIAVLKTVGFTDARALGLVLAESGLLAILGGGIGLGLGAMAVGAGDPTGGFLPIFYFPTKDMIWGVIFVLLLGIVAGILPAYQAMRMKIVDAFEEGLIVNWLAQVFAVTATAVRTIPQRRGAALATVAGIAGVVAVLVGVLSIGEGFRHALRSAGSPQNALVLRSGSDSEMMSVLLGDAVEIIAQAPGIARGAVAAGEAPIPLSSAELFVVVDVPKKSTGTPANVPLRGVQPAAFLTRPELKLTAGRMLEWGKNEILVGEGALRQFRGLDVGTRVKWGQNEWTVVGTFFANGALWESELWTDARVLQPSYRRGNSFQTVVARLESPEAFDRFKDTLTKDPRLDVTVQRESEFFGNQGRSLQAIIRQLGFLLAVLMGIGAVFGALNTMYSAVAARTREVATLRALGFGPGAVVVSVMAESMLLALCGGVVGALLAWVFFDGVRTSTLNWDTFSQVTFAFDVTPALLAQGVFFALVLGLAGGLFPAIRAARLPVTAALREA